MASETHVGPPPGSRLREGAAQGAPTAPHATPRPGGGRKNGPERFWDERRVRIALAATTVVSIAVHVWLGPWSTLPQGVDVNDVEGDVGIPIDIVTEPAPPPPPPPPAPAATAASDDSTAAAKRAIDAGVTDAALADAAHDSASDASDAARDSGRDGARDDGGEAAADAGKKDPMAMFGASNDLKAADVYVDIIINGEEIRKHPVGAQMGPLLSSIPEWDSFIAGTNVDPVKQADWVRISGPSIVNSSRDVIIVRFNGSDAVVDKAIDVIAARSFKGGPFDAGVPNVKAALGTADNAPRVFLRPRAGVLAVVPPYYAPTAAKILASASVPAHYPGGHEAMRMRLRDPWRPFPQIPKTVTEVRLWIVPKSDGGADVFAEGDCATEAECADATDQLTRVFDGYRTGFAGIGVRALTHGLLDSLELTAEGKHVKLHLEPTQDQLETLIDIVGKQITRLKSPPPPPPPNAPSTPPAAPR